MIRPAHGPSMIYKAKLQPGQRQVSRSEQTQIMRDFDRIMVLHLRGIATDRDRQRLLRRWVKHWDLILPLETKKVMGI